MKKLLSAFCIIVFFWGTAHAKVHRRHSWHGNSTAQATTTDPVTGETVKDPNAPTTPLEFALTKEKEQLTREITELKKISANAVQIKSERDDLEQKRVVLERELQQIKVENQALKDSANQDWFLYGGGLALAGVLLGFILPKIRWGRQNRWDTF